jgi:hypothetical protein
VVTLARHVTTDKAGTGFEQSSQPFSVVRATQM